jgi:NADPH2:quinone reductase
VIHEVLPAREAARAHALMEASAHIGKLVLSWEDG